MVPGPRLGFPASCLCPFAVDGSDCPWWASSGLAGPLCRSWVTLYASCRFVPLQDLDWRWLDHLVLVARLVGWE